MKSNLPTHLDARGARGRYSRGNARYGVSQAPRTGNINSVQKAAQRRLKEMEKKQARFRKGS